MSNPNHQANGKFGSSEKIEVECAVCGKKMSRTPSRAKVKRFYCSYECQRKDMPSYLPQFTKGQIPWNKREIKMVKCACGCGREFNENDGNRRRNSKYYSLECYWKSKIGGTPWNKGLKGQVHVSEETKEKHRIAALKFWKSEKVEVKCAVCGKKIIRTTISTKGKKRFYCSHECLWKRGSKRKVKKLCLYCKKKFISYISENKKYCSKKCHDKWMKENSLPSSYYSGLGLRGMKSLGKKNPTSIEVKLYNELKERRLLFETQKIINGKFVVDAYIPKLNLIIEADGDYWHNLDKIKRKDKSENAYLKKCGFNLLRLTGTEINNDVFKEKIKEVIGG